MQRREKTSFAPFDGVGPTGSKGQAQRLSQPVRRHDGRQLAFLGSPAMRLHYGNTNRQVPAAPRMGNDCCTPEGDCHEVFHDWWLEDRPALNTCSKVWSRTIRFEIEGLGGARPEALNVGLDAWDLILVVKHGLSSGSAITMSTRPRTGPVRPMIRSLARYAVVLM